jgi:hypothetical protein
MSNRSEWAGVEPGSGGDRGDLALVFPRRSIEQTNRLVPIGPVALERIAGGSRQSVYQTLQPTSVHLGGRLRVAIKLPLDLSQEREPGPPLGPVPLEAG